MTEAVLEAEQTTDKDTRGQCTGQTDRQTQLERSQRPESGRRGCKVTAPGAEDLCRQPVSVRSKLIRSPRSQELFLLVHSWTH